MFVTNVDRLGGGVVVPVYGCSVEQYLLDVTAEDAEFDGMGVGASSRACEMITMLGRLGASASVRTGLGLEGGLEGYVFPSKDTALGIVRLVEPLLTSARADLSVAVIGIMRRMDVMYAVVVPYVSGTAVEAYGLPYIRSGPTDASHVLRVTEEGKRHEGAAVVVVRQPRPSSVVCVYFVTVDFGMGGVPIGVVFELRDGKYTGTVWFFETIWFSVLTTRRPRDLPYRASSDEELRDVVGMVEKVNSQDTGTKLEALHPMKLTRHEIKGAITRIGSYKGPIGGGMYTMLTIEESGKETAKCVMSSSYGYDEDSLRKRLTYRDVKEGDVFQDVVCDEGLKGGITGLKVVRREGNEGEILGVESARGVRLVERELRGVKIGAQTWTAANLDVGEYGDGGGGRSRRRRAPKRGRMRTRGRWERGATTRITWGTAGSGGSCITCMRLEK